MGMNDDQYDYSVKSNGEGYYIVDCFFVIVYVKISVIGRCSLIKESAMKYVVLA